MDPETGLSDGRMDERRRDFDHTCRHSRRRIYEPLRRPFRDAIGCRSLDHTLTQEADLFTAGDTPYLTGLVLAPASNGLGPSRSSNPAC